MKQTNASRASKLVIKRATARHQKTSKPGSTITHRACRAINSFLPLHPAYHLHAISFTNHRTSHDRRVTCINDVFYKRKEKESGKEEKQEEKEAASISSEHTTQHNHHHHSATHGVPHLSSSFHYHIGTSTSHPNARTLDQVCWHN